MLQAQSVPVEVSMTPDAKGFVVLKVHNLASSPLTGYVYTTIFDAPSSDGTSRRITGVGFQDAATQPRVKPIPPGGSDEYTVRNPKPHVTFQAAVFADGTSFGDAAWVHRILHRRAFAAKNIEAATSIVQRAVLDGSSENEVIQELRAAEARADGEAEDPCELPVGRGAYAQGLTSLAHPPKHGDGSPFVTQETLQHVLFLLSEMRDRLKPYQ